MQRVNGYKFTNDDEEAVVIFFDGETLRFEFETAFDGEGVIEVKASEAPQLLVAADEIATRYKNRNLDL